MNIALVGYGAMGKEIEAIAIERGHSISARFDVNTPLSLAALRETSTELAIDFSHASAVQENARICGEAGVNLVIGTTGWNAEKPQVEQIARQHSFGVVYGSNYSVGMQLFFRIVQRAAELVNATPNYDVMLHELHHHRKVDSPSGTALSIAEILVKNIQRKESILSETSHGAIAANALHLSSTRGGEIPGTHTVYMDSLADSIEITHRARNRNGFALGAVLAAEWLAGKQGFYDFSDIFESVVG